MCDEVCIQGLSFYAGVLDCIPSFIQFFALSASFTSKYFTLAVVKGIQNMLMPFSHFLSPTSARRSISLKCLKSNYMFYRQRYTKQETPDTPPHVNRTFDRPANRPDNLIH